MLGRHERLSSKQMTALIGMLGRESGLTSKQRLDWVVAWAAERKALDVFNYSSYISQLTQQGGRLRDVEAAFEQMQAAGVTPTVVRTTPSSARTATASSGRRRRRCSSRCKQLG